MKNIKKLPRKLVPKKLRFELYQQALVYYTGINKPMYGLCMYLPMILWGLENSEDKAPNGQDWFCSDTLVMFPELKKELNRLGNPFVFKEVERIDFLKKVLNS